MKGSMRIRVPPDEVISNAAWPSHWTVMGWRACAEREAGSEQCRTGEVAEAEA